jgi:hypothetical protein
MKTILNFTKIICLLTVFFFHQNINAQAPNKMSYQAVVRNASNALVTSAPVGMKISILQGSASGTAVFEESHTATTNTNGLAAIEIGNGTVISGSMSGIDWAAGPYFLKTETDPAGGNAYSITGTSELMSVPYAKFAENTSAWTTALGTTSNNTDKIGIGTNSPATKLHVTSVAGNVATFNGGNGMWVTLSENGTERGYIGSFAGNPEDVELGTIGGNITGAVHLTTNNIPKLTVVNNGNVGIGNTTPDFPLSFPTTYGEKISIFGNASSRVGFAVQPGNFQMLGDVSGTDLTFGHGLSASSTELMRIKGSTGNIGIGTATPDYKLTVVENSGSGLLKLQSSSASTQITLDDGGLNDVYLTTTQGDFDVWTGGNNKRLSVITNGNVGVGTSAPTTKLEVNGGTKLGSNAPAIKMLKFTGTTGNSQGASTQIPHGLNSSKILAVNVLVEYTSGSTVPPSYTINGGYEYHYYVTPSFIDVWMKSANSASILNKPFTILVTYEE